jgi:hypothetical protein
MIDGNKNFLPFEETAGSAGAMAKGATVRPAREWWRVYHRRCHSVEILVLLEPGGAQNSWDAWRGMIGLPTGLDEDCEGMRS